MGLDIGQALREGASRTAGRNGLLVAAVFAGIALLTTVLFQSLLIAAAESALSTFQSASPQELGLAPAEYDDAITQFETAHEQVRSNAPFAVDLSAGIAAAGLLVLAIGAEAVSIAAVRVFATDEPGTATADLITDNALLATLNGFVGKIVVWGLILVGSLFLLVPGVVLAVLFFFLRQEIAIHDKNFVQGMADSWRVTKGHRVEVFLVGAVLVIVSRFEEVTSAAIGVVSTPAGTVAAAVVGGLLGAFGTAAATRAYVQIGVDEGGDATDDAEPDEEPKDPYDAALSADDLTR
ncbi:hypothetical protein [Natronomonas sp. LN261]|uniref:hypothetical protein n=1 Tax=Natronomonas sp. LN261 TaxID=2750669 RepID=UPI0015EECAA6|nr:hypothetical protein [Natronomonas sp. LN261]